MNKNESVAYHVEWVDTLEFSGRKFPLVYLHDGSLSYSLSCYLNHLYKMKKAKGTSSLSDLFRVVAELNYYLIARSNTSSCASSDWEDNPQRLVLEFFADLYHGTINKNGMCEYKLYWKGISYDTLKKLIAKFEDYSEYVANYLGYNKIKVNDVLERTSKQSHEFFKKSDYTLLQHLNMEEDAESWNTKGITYSDDPAMKHIGKGKNEYKFFPPKYLSALITGELDINQQAMYLLCAFTALRASEALQIMITDVVPSDESLFREVILSSPVDETWCPTKNKFISREKIFDTYKNETFLSDIDFDLDDEALEYARNPIPRVNLPLNNRYKAGWKGITPEYEKAAKYGYVLEWTDDYARLLFEKLINKLLQQKRSNHPFLICNKADGMPLAYNTYYRRLHRKSNKLTGKGYGTHSLRHFAGFYIANKLKKSKEEAQPLLRHFTVLSTERYYHITKKTAKNAFFKNKMYSAAHALKEDWESLDFKHFKNIKV